MAHTLAVEHDSQLADAVRDSMREILDGAALFVLATAGPDAGPHANTAYFACDDDLIAYFVSERSTRHSLNLGADPRATAAIFLEPPTYGEDLRGLQLAGRVAQASADETAHALAAYRGKFASFAADPVVADRFLRAEGPAVLYRFTIDAVTVLDEPRFGRRNYIRAVVSR